MPRAHSPLLQEPDGVFCVNLFTWVLGHPLHSLWFWNCVDCVWEFPEVYVHPLFTATGFHHCISGSFWLCMRSSSAGHIQELLVHWEKLLYFFDLLWYGILILFSLPPLLHLHQQVHHYHWVEKLKNFQLKKIEKRINYLENGNGF